MSSTGWREKDDRTIAELREGMEALRLDAFIPSKAAHCAYLTNYYDKLHTAILWEEMQAILVVPLERDAFIVGAHEHWAGLPDMGVAPWWLRERLGTWAGGYICLEDTVAALKTKGLARGRIGVETNWMPAAVHAYLQAALPDAELVAANQLVPQIRLVKTSREQRLMAHAVHAGWGAMDAYMGALRNGATRREAELVRAERCLDFGAEWVGGPYHVAWTGGPNETPAWWDAPARSSFMASPGYRYWQGAAPPTPYCVTHFETAFQYYYSDLAWHELYGMEPDDAETIEFGQEEVTTWAQARHDYEVLRLIQRGAIQVIKPGMDQFDAKRAVDAFLAADAEVADHQRGYFLHGIGLEIHEEPVLTGSVEATVPPDAAICYRPGAVISSEWFSKYWTVEDPFVLRESGWEPLAELRGLTSCFGGA